MGGSLKNKKFTFTHIRVMGFGVVLGKNVRRG
jgi:hypothetical protein